MVMGSYEKWIGLSETLFRINLQHKHNSKSSYYSEKYSSAFKGKSRREEKSGTFTRAEKIRTVSTTNKSAITDHV